MLKELIDEGFGVKEDLNCAEKILYGANKVYDLNLDSNSLKLAAGFGGGMAIEDKCGALTAAIMVLGTLAVEKNAHESDRIKVLVKELFSEYKKETGSIDCAPLKDKYRTPEKGCLDVISIAAGVLDKIVIKEKLL